MQWRRGEIIERFGKFAAALRKKNAARIELLGGLQRLHQRFVKPTLLGKLCDTGRARRKVRFNQRRLLLAGFSAGIENQERPSLFALELSRLAHRRPPNWLRSLRVARNSEFFTVSSVVPRASPMARNFNP